MPYYDNMHLPSLFSLTVQPCLISHPFQLCSTVSDRGVFIGYKYMYDTVLQLMSATSGTSLIVPGFPPVASILLNKKFMIVTKMLTSSLHESATSPVPSDLHSFRSLAPY